MARRKTDDLVAEALERMLPSILAKAMATVQAPTVPSVAPKGSIAPATRTAKVAKPKADKLVADSFEVRHNEVREGWSNVYFFDAASGETAAPSVEIRNELKEHSFRFHPTTKRWYGRTKFLPATYKK